MANPRSLRFSLAMFVFAPSAQLMAELSRSPTVSKHISDAILEGYRIENSKQSPPIVSAPLDVEPGAVVLPGVKIEAKKHVVPSGADLVVPTEAVPVVLGSGVTEIKGRKFTILTRKIFFIPIAWKIEW